MLVARAFRCGGGSPARLQYRHYGQHERGRFRQTNCPPLLPPPPPAKHAPLPIIAAGKLNRVALTVALAAQASAIVTGDTVMLHIASALQIPVVGIYGSTRPSINTPLFGPHVLLYDASVPCAPCYKEHCPLKGAEHLQCQRKVTHKQVLVALDSLLFVGDASSQLTAMN